MAAAQWAAREGTVRLRARHVPGQTLVNLQAGGTPFGPPLGSRLGRAAVAPPGVAGEDELPNTWGHQEQEPPPVTQPSRPNSPRHLELPYPRPLARRPAGRRASECGLQAFRARPTVGEADSDRQQPGGVW